MAKPDLICPTCGGELEPADADRTCEKCRTPRGKIAELWIAFECQRKFEEPIPNRLLNGEGWIGLERAGHALARREDRHEEYKADGQTGKLEFLIRWAMGEHGISRNDCFGMRVADFLQKIEQIDPPEKQHSPNLPSGEDSAQVKRTRPRKRQWLAEALLLKRDHPHLSDAEIAKSVGKHPSTLSRCLEYQALARLARGTKSDRHKGFQTHDSETGLTDVDGISFDDLPDE